MKIVFVADGRSPTAINWIRHFVTRGDNVHLASTSACQPDLDLQSLQVIPVALSGMRSSAKASKPRSAFSRTLNLLLPPGIRTSIKHTFGPLTITRAAKKLRRMIEDIQPDLVHAMRIPYEGMLAADAYKSVPLLVSIWGNDFTLHAPSTRMMRHYTRWTMQVADALHADCQRDIRLSGEWGFSMKRPTLVIPGGGGISGDIFYPPAKPVNEPVVINPRGFRPYVRNEVFFQAIPLVLKEIPTARFLCTSMADEALAIQWIEEFGIGHAVELLPLIPHVEMADVYRRAAVLVSPSVHDGTPNTLLEGMACGCFPIAGNLESIREWITNGENGLLTDATDPRRLAEAILHALEDSNMRKKATKQNALIIKERAEYNACMKLAEKFYERIVKT